MKIRFQSEMHRMVTELKLLKTLSHPSILQLKDAYLVQDSVWVVTELADTDLFKYRHGHYFSPSEIAYIGHQLFSAVAYLDSNNIIHRDISLRTSS